MNHKHQQMCIKKKGINWDYCPYRLDGDIYSVRVQFTQRGKIRLLYRKKTIKEQNSLG